MPDTSRIADEFHRLVVEALPKGRQGNKWGDLRELLASWFGVPIDDVNATEVTGNASKYLTGRLGQEVSRAKYAGLVVTSKPDVSYVEDRLRGAIEAGRWAGSGLVASEDADGRWRLVSVIENPNRGSPYTAVASVFPEARRLSAQPIAAEKSPSPRYATAMPPAWTFTLPDREAWETLQDTRLLDLVGDAETSALNSWEGADLVAFYGKKIGVLGILEVSSLHDSGDRIRVEFTEPGLAGDSRLNPELAAFSAPAPIYFEQPQYSTSFRVGPGDLHLGKLDGLQVGHLAAVAQGTASMSDRLPRAWLVLQKSGSGYEDVQGIGYHFPSHIPNGKRILERDVLVCRTETIDGSYDLFGVGRVGRLVTKEDGTRRAFYDRYADIAPPMPLDELGEDPRNNPTNSIQPFPWALVPRLLQRVAADSPEGLPVLTSPSTAPTYRGREPEAPSFDELTVSGVQSLIDEQALALPADVVPRCVAALRAGKHLLLTGPPGTGKTTLGQVLADAAAQLGLARGAVLATATADWTSADTVGGYWLEANNKLAFHPGQVLRAIRENEWLIVDELNRADIDKAFGQLFTVMSGQAVTLPFRLAVESGDLPVSVVPFGKEAPEGTSPFYVVSSWRMVATLNTRDRDLLFSMSHALLRRFAVVDVGNPPGDHYRELLKEQVPTGSADLDSALASLIDLPHRSLGPAILLDAGKYIRARVHLHGNAGDWTWMRAVLREALYSFVLPQLDDLPLHQLQDIVGHVHRATMQGQGLDETLHLFAEGTQLTPIQLQPASTDDPTADNS